MGESREEHPRGRNSKYKGPEAELHLLYLLGEELGNETGGRGGRTRHCRHSQVTARLREK